VEKARLADGNQGKEEVMTAQVETLASAQTQPEANGQWTGWLDRLAPFKGTIRGVVYAGYPENRHDLLIATAGGVYDSYWPDKIVWEKVITPRGNPLLHGLTAVVAGGLLRVYALTDDILLCASRASDGAWEYREEVRPPFVNVMQFFAMQDGDVTDLYAITTDGDLFAMRPGSSTQWKKKHAFGAISGSLAGYASSAPNRREIAVGVNKEIHLYVATADGAFVKQQEPLELDFIPRHVLLAAPRPKGQEALYAIAVASDGKVVSSRFRYETATWEATETGAAGLTVLETSTAAAISIGIGCLNLMVTDDQNVRIAPRQFR
jgi:hypothetical protein